MEAADFQAAFSMYKVNNKDIRMTSAILFRCQLCCSGVVIINFEHISHLFLLFFFVDFEQVDVYWEFQ